MSNSYPYDYIQDAQRAAGIHDGPRRFTVVLQESMPTCDRLIIVNDTLTGVNYLIAAGDHGEGITPLLTRNGLPSIDR